MKSGDICKCGGRYLVDCTRQLKNRPAAIRYLKCENCGARGTQRIKKPASQALRRKKSTSLVQKIGKIPASQQIEIANGSFPSTIETGGGNLNGPSNQYIRSKSSHLNGEAKAMEKLLNINETAALCGTDWPTIKNWVDWGSMPMPLLVGGYVRWRRSDLQKWTADHCPQTPSPLDDFSDEVVQALLMEFRAAAEKLERTEK